MLIGILNEQGSHFLGNFTFLIHQPYQVAKCNNLASLLVFLSTFRAFNQLHLLCIVIVLIIINIISNIDMFDTTWCRNIATKRNFIALCDAQIERNRKSWILLSVRGGGKGGHNFFLAYFTFQAISRGFFLKKKPNILLKLHEM